MRLRTHNLFAVALAVALAAPALAQESNSFVIVARRALTMAEGDPAYIDNAVIVVRNGRIEAVGSGIALPPDLPVLRFPDDTIMPGLIDAASRIGGAHAGDESVAAGYRAVDTFNPYADYAEFLAGGITTVHLNPGPHRLVTGAGAVVKLGGPPSDRVIKTEADLTINLGERAFDPPRDVTYVTPASSDIAIPPGVRQRPAGRLGQILELDEQIRAASAERPDNFNFHQLMFRRSWTGNLPLRIQVRRAADLEQAVEFVRRHNRAAYLVGVEEGHLLADELADARLPLVVQVDAVFGRPFANIGPDPDAFDPATDNAAALEKLDFALAGSFSTGPDKLRLAAVTAVRGGLSPAKALAAITRVPADVLGIADRVGAIAPGKDADLLVLSGDPLDAAVNVRRVYVGGHLAFCAPESNALVIKAGRIWTGTDQVIHDGAVLIEDGRIAAVGRTVPRPRFARVVDAGSDAFLTPGFIDAHGHLGLEGDQSTVESDLRLARITGHTGPQHRRVARAGITTVMLSPYAVGARGGCISAIKTAGDNRETLITREVAAVKFSFQGQDPLLGTKSLKSALEAGKKYLESWQKYQKELEQWEKDRAEGKTAAKPPGEVETVEQQKADPITGTWSLTLSGGPMPEPVTVEMLLRLDGNRVEGRIRVPGESEEGVITGTFSGNHLSAVVDVETPMGKPAIEADIDREDHMVGTVSLGEFTINLDATRTDKSAVEFKVTRQKKRGKDGRPLPPKVDPALEPIRQMLEQKIPAVVDVSTAAAIENVVKLVVEEFKAPLVLLNGHEADRAAQKLIETKIGVILPTQIVQKRDRVYYDQADDLARRGVHVAFQSDAEDGARGLPLQALFAVEQGADPDAVLRAMTIDAARMFKIDDRIGAIQPGRDADLVIFSGHPFEAGSRIQRVFIAGKEVE